MNIDVGTPKDGDTVSVGTIISTVRIRFAWWWRPYFALTLLGARMGLPVDEDVVAKDLVRAMRVTLHEH